MPDPTPETPAASPAQGRTQPSRGGPVRAEGLTRRLRPWWFPLAMLALLEVYVRSVAKGSDTLAPPSAALRAFAGAIAIGLVACVGQCSHVNNCIKQMFTCQAGVW